jgi:hypothetical protein
MNRLTPGMARIRVKDLRLRTYIGIKEEEILNRQDVLINLTILYPAAEAVEVNQIDQALNYRTITKAVIRHVADNRCANASPRNCWTWSWPTSRSSMLKWRWTSPMPCALPNRFRSP